MSMVVRTNIMAVNANRQLGMNNSQVGKSLEKLASGFRINRAGDDASGLAISEKMKAQIKGLETASANSQDGISLIQTAEGALTEVHDMLNRMVELAGKAANGTMDDDVDRAALQKELDSLKTEINRISQGTNFNGKLLLDGSLDAAKTGYAVSLPSTHDNIQATQNISITGLDSDVKGVIFNVVDDTTEAISVSLQDGLLTINITADSTGGAKKIDDLNQALKDADINGTVSSTGASDVLGDIFVAAGSLTTVAPSKAEVTTARFTADKADCLAGFSFTFGKGATGLSSITFTTANAAPGAALTSAGALTITLDDGSSTNKMYTAEDINNIFKGMGIENIKVSFTGEQKAEDVIKGLGFDGLTPTAATLTDGVGEIGNGLTLQVGDTADSYNKVTVSIADMSTQGLGIDTISVADQDSASIALTALKNTTGANNYGAINRVSSTRADLGALQNKLEHTINNLDVAAENLTSANSRIRDTDMAKQMMEYTKMNVLTQAAQAMLAQANMQPQSILQLLQ